MVRSLETYLIIYIQIQKFQGIFNQAKLVKLVEEPQTFMYQRRNKSSRKLKLQTEHNVFETFRNFQSNKSIHDGLTPNIKMENQDEDL